KENGMTLAEMARYLLAQNAGDEFAEGGRAEWGSDLPYSENIEDARNDPPFVQPPGERGWFNARKAEYAVDPQLIFEHENRNQPSPLGNQVGYGDIGKAPEQVIVAYGADGKGRLAHFRGGAYRGLAWQRDRKTLAASLREDGTTVHNPVMFTL